MDPKRIGEKATDGGNADPLLKSEAPTDSTKPKQDEQTPKPAAPAKASGASPEPSPAKKADPPAEGAKAPADSKTDPQAKRTQEKDPRREQKLAFLAGEAKDSDQPATTPDASKAKDGEEPAAADKAAAPGEKPAESKTQQDDELPTDRKKAAEAFANLRRENREAKKQLEHVELLKNDAETGRGLVELLEKHRVVDDFQVVNDEELAGVIAVQAAMNRAAKALASKQVATPDDVKLIEGALGALEDAAGQLGIARGGVVEAKPFTGKLPEDLQALVDAEWLPEERVRKLHALELAEVETAKAAKTPRQAAPAAKTETKAPAAPANSIARASAPQQRQASADELLYIGKSKRHLQEHGVAPEAIAGHYKERLIPLIVNDLIAPTLSKGVDPVKVWVAASPQAKHEFLVEAQALYERRNAEQQQQTRTPPPKPPAKSDQPRQPLFQRAFARGLGRRNADPTNRDPKARLAFLAGEAGE